MSVYGNMIFESYEYNNVIVNEFSLSVLKNKFNKNDKLFSKLKTKLKELKSNVSVNKKVKPTDIDKSKSIQIGRLVIYNVALQKASDIHSKSNDELEKIDKELKNMISKSSIDVDRLKEIKDLMKSIDLSTIDRDPKKMAGTTMTTYFKDGATTKDLEKNLNVGAVQQYLIRDIVPIVRGCIDEAERTISVSKSINESILKIIEQIEKSNDDKVKEYAKEIEQISKEQLLYTKSCSTMVYLAEKALDQRFKLIRIYGENKEDLFRYYNLRDSK